VLINPSEYRPIVIPRKGVYVAYKAYFINEYIKDTEQKIFDVVFPLTKFERATKALPKEPVIDLTRPILMEFMYTRNYNILIKRWENL